MENLKPYQSCPPEVGPTHKAPLQELVDDKEKFEVEDIIAHRLVCPHKLPEYLVRFKGYGLEDGLWLPQRNLELAPENQARQTNNLS